MNSILDNQKYQCWEFELEYDVTESLIELANAQNISLFSLLLGAYYLLLGAYDRQNNTVIIDPHAASQNSKEKNTSNDCFFVNLFDFRDFLGNKQLALVDFLIKIEEELLKEARYLDISSLLNSSSDEGGAARNSIQFYTIFQIHQGTITESFCENSILDKGHLNKNIEKIVKELNFSEIQTKSFNINSLEFKIFTINNKKKITGKYFYTPKEFVSDIATAYLDTYLVILKQFSQITNGVYKKRIDSDDRLRVAELTYLSSVEYKKIVQEWNNTDIEFPIQKTIHEVFEEKACAVPDRIAITYDDLNITYQELNERSNQLAHYLKQKYTVTPDTLVALFLDRSEHMIMAILGVLKAGGAYVAIAPNYPDERIRKIIESTVCSVILTNEAYEDKVARILEGWKNSKIEIMPIDSLAIGEQLFLQCRTNLQHNVKSSNLAYVITTSGSTGIPKLVMVEHKGVVNLKCDFTNKFGLNKNNQDTNETVLQLANYVFDGSMEELIVSLLNGYRLLIVRDNLWTERKKFCEYLNKNQVTHIEVTPTFASLYDLSGISTLRRIEVAGEMLTEKSFNMINRTDNCEIINAYGATEVSMVSTLAFLKSKDKITIGKPVSNTKVYVLDAHLSPVPVGAVGELYISGIGLARGYLNRPDLTSEKFIANPFHTVATRNSKLNEFEYTNTRLYKTGDLVKWLPNGQLEYVGRNDFQVKLRGYRIELEEIENALLEYNGIKQCVVVAQSSADRANELSENKYLVGYYVSDHKLDEEALSKYLQTKLLSHMVPSVFVYLPKMPLTYNGKLDRKSLPKPDLDASTNCILPRNELESKVSKIWGETLGIPKDKVYIDDDFFKLGGNSILLIRFVSAINNEFESNIKFMDIFNLKTIKKISELIHSRMGQSVYKEFQVIKTDEENLYHKFSLNNVQQAYYLGRSTDFDLGNIATHTYTEYQFSYLNVERLEKAFNKLINRHLALRTIFLDDSQLFIEKVPYYHIKSNEISDENELSDMRNCLSHKVYDPSVYPLFDIVVSKLKQKNHYILHVSFDALLLDANSMVILFTELTILYNSPNVELLPLGISYRDYMVQYSRIRASSLLKSSEEYWYNRLEDYNFDMGLPLATAESAVKNPKFKRIIKIIENDVWEKLLKKIQDKNLSPISLMLAVYGRVLSFWSGQDRVCINLTLFNRLPLHQQINDIIGDFTVLELYSYYDECNKPIGDVLKAIHENFWNDIEHNLFDGIDFQRLIRKEKAIPSNQIIAPIVLTSMLGNENKDQDTFVAGETFIDPSYVGVNYSISQTSQVWIDNQIYTVKAGLAVQWDYVEQLFEKDTIDAMHNAYCRLIEDLAECDWETDRFPQISIPKFDRKLISRCSGLNYGETQGDIYLNENQDTLFSRYERIVHQENFYEKIAVIDEGIGESYQYRQLIKDTESLAKYLFKSANFHSGLMGVLCEKGYSQIVSVLSIMKCGGGYLPINIDWPIGRIEEILEQGMAKIILVSKALEKKMQLIELWSNKFTVLVVEDLLLHVNDFGNDGIKLPSVNANDIAYVIFTSGSTGRPKGVTISHKGALNTIDAVNKNFHISSRDRILALSDLSFDLSVYDIFGMLTVGGLVVLPDQENIKDPRHWLRLINKYEITIWDTVPQLAELLINEAEFSNASDLSSLKLFLLSGDWIPIKLPDKIRENIRCPDVKIISLGGATEGSIWSIWYDIHDVNPEWKSIPYGVAMPNQKMFVLNSQGQHSPVGVTGEIYIGGDGVALNYWNNNTLTEKQFIHHDTLGKLYKTGDVGRWHKSGYMEFIGRKDTQVKIRGYRVELEEITIELLKLDQIETAVVKFQRHSDQNYIVGYIVPKKQRDITLLLQPSLKQYLNQKLSHKLPEYMLPHDYILIDKLPLSNNGKLELNRLPLLEITVVSTYVAPRNHLEKKICNAWSRILGISESSISINDDFFQLGGNSLFAIQLITILTNETNINIKLKDIYKKRTISNILKYCHKDINDSVETGLL